MAARSARFHAKHQAREHADALASETGQVAAVYLDSLGFIACLQDDMERTDCSRVYTTATAEANARVTASAMRKRVY